MPILLWSVSKKQKPIIKQNQKIYKFTYIDENAHKYQIHQLTKGIWIDWKNQMVFHATTSVTYMEPLPSANGSLISILVSPAPLLEYHEYCL